MRRADTTRVWRRVFAAVTLALTGAWLVPGAAQVAPIPPGDWPQFARDGARSGYTPIQVDPPYCYVWKWYEAPVAGRAQPVVADGRLFVGAMDGVVYARDAATGSPLWQVATGGPIRHSPAVTTRAVIVGSHDGYTYALRPLDGDPLWRTRTGPSATAPLLDTGRSRVYVASTDGTLTALAEDSGTVVWRFDAGAPILTTPALTTDGGLVVFGSEAIEAIAVDAATGLVRWRRTLQGQSLADRSPVVVGASIVFRSQPLHFFHDLLHDGDDTMDSAGPVLADWAADWATVRPRIVAALTERPSTQTAFVLDASTGAPRGVAPILYTYGNNDTPAMPVAQDTTVFVPFRARHGIQTDGGAVHVTSRYDAELGRLDLATLDVTALRQANWPTYRNEFRMTSDEPAALTLAGTLLLVDNWERLGGIDTRTGSLVHVAAVSNDWPECFVQCGPGTPNPFFPMNGSGAAYPFPSPRVTEGHQRAGAVVANGLIYWKVIEGGLAAIGHRTGATCAPPRVWAGSSARPSSPTAVRIPAATSSLRPLADYVDLDLTMPAGSPPPDLVERLRQEVRAITTTGAHLMPYYVQRGFSQPQLWPWVTTNPPGPPAASHNGHGNVYWHDPGEFLYTMALAYPYLDGAQQAELTAYVADEMRRYPPLANLPWNGQPWLKQGAARERYVVPFRSELNNWPPAGASLHALYGLWLWSRNTGDWSYAASSWSDAQRLWNARKSSVQYYADLAGMIGYVRLAAQLGDEAAEQDGRAHAVQAMQAGLAFDDFRLRAEQQYLDPRDEHTGWSLPVFYGLTPEVGLFLRERLGSEALDHLRSREQGNGLRWWYLTRVGAHAEIGETSFAAPTVAWSHFLAHAYIAGTPQDTLLGWLDRPWCRGDLYSIQKTVAAIHAPR